MTSIFKFKPFLCAVLEQLYSEENLFVPDLILSPDEVSSGFLEGHKTLTKSPSWFDFYELHTANVLSAEITDECLQTKSKDNLQ